MKKINQPHAEDDTTTFDDTRKEIVFQIISKLSDFKTLCICKLVCKRFYETVRQVDAISFTSVTRPLVYPPGGELNISICVTLLSSFKSVVFSLKMFTRVKSSASNFHLRVMIHCFGGVEGNLDPVISVIRRPIEHGDSRVPGNNNYEVDINTLTMKQYLALVRGNQASGVVKPKIKGNVNFEIKSKFMQEFRKDTFSGNKNEDAHKHVERILNIVSLFNIPGVSQDAVMLRIFPLTLTGAAKI
ncbi:uncharacterized mitochondrial protein-like protein [Tanacetum coccineum]